MLLRWLMSHYSVQTILMHNFLSRERCWFGGNLLKREHRGLILVGPCTMLVCLNEAIACSEPYSAFQQQDPPCPAESCDQADVLGVALTESCRSMESLVGGEFVHDSKPNLAVVPSGCSCALRTELQPSMSLLSRQKIFKKKYSAYRRVSLRQSGCLM